MLGGRAYAGARGNAICFGAPPVEDAASGLAPGRRRRPRAGRGGARRPVARRRRRGRRRPALGAGLAWLVNALDPGAVVIGGGLGLVDRYRELAVAAMRPLIFADNTRDLPVLAGGARAPTRA